MLHDPFSKVISDRNDTLLISGLQFKIAMLEKLVKQAYLEGFNTGNCTDADIMSAKECWKSSNTKRSMWL